MKEIIKKLDKVIEKLEKCQSFSIGVASQSTVPIGYSAKVKPELYYVVKDKDGKIGWIKGSEYNSSIQRVMWKYGALVNQSLAQRFASEAENDQEKGRSYNRHEYDYDPLGLRSKRKNFSNYLDSIKEMAREDAKFYKNKENNPNNLSIEELAARCYEERVKYPSDDAQDAFYGEFMRTFN